jgi:hypothetical protein
VIASSGFVLESLKLKNGIEEFTSIRFRGRYAETDEFQVSKAGGMRMYYRKSNEKIRFPILEHRTNSSWSLLNAGSEDQHTSILIRDTYGKGELLTLVTPDLFSQIKKIPRETLGRIREELAAGDLYLEGPPQVSLFTYDNGTFGVYSYTTLNSAPDWIRIHFKGKASGLSLISSDYAMPAPAKIAPLSVSDTETIFEFRVEPGDYLFYKIEK